MRREQLVTIGLSGIVGLLGAVLGGLLLSRGASGEVEKSVKAGITAGVDEALAPETVRDRSRAAAQGFVDGLVDSAAERVAPVSTGARPEAKKVVRQGARLAEEAAGLAGDAATLGLDVMDAFLGGRERVDHDHDHDHEHAAGEKRKNDPLDALTGKR